MRRCLKYSRRFHIFVSAFSRMAHVFRKITSACGLVRPPCPPPRAITRDTGQQQQEKYKVGTHTAAALTAPTLIRDTGQQQRKTMRSHTQLSLPHNKRAHHLVVVLCPIVSRLLHYTEDDLAVTDVHLAPCMHNFTHTPTHTGGPEPHIFLSGVGGSCGIQQLGGGDRDPQLTIRLHVHCGGHKTQTQTQTLTQA